MEQLKRTMPFNYIETTCEPTLNLSVPLDESSLELYPSQEVMLSSEEGSSIKTIANKVDNCIKIVVDVQDKLSKCTLTKLDLLNALENTLTDFEEDEVDLKPHLNNRNIHITFRLLAYIHQSLVNTKLNF